jgi:UDP:flavonoid glycosyltransferase YjiC (YdhE family)
MPLGADQPSNARRAAQLGVARVFDAASATPEELRASVATVLDDPSYQRAALRLRDEIAALPAPGQMVRLLERLSEEGRPIRSA